MNFGGSGGLPLIRPDPQGQWPLKVSDMLELGLKPGHDVSKQEGGDERLSSCVLF